MINAGGSEANEILANTIRKNILLDNELDYHNAFLYLYANNDLSGYVSFAPNISRSDITQYVANINGHYGNSKIKIERLQLFGLLSILLDPINYYSFNSLFNEYIWRGKNKGNIHLIRVTDDIKYLPKFKFGLTPYGPELTLQNYIKDHSKLFSLNIGRSDGSIGNSWRIGAEAWNIKLNDQISLNLSGQIWNQQNIDFYVNDELENSTGMGGLFINTINYDFHSRENTLGLMLQLGYKSKGFSAGENLNSGLIIRGGATFRLKTVENKI